MKWFSHRGYHKKYTENSRGAFLEAYNQGFSCIETDLQVTGDGHLLLYHDPDMRRLSGSSDRISELSRVELESRPLPCGERTLFLDAFIETCRPQDAVIFDVKPYNATKCIQALTDFINQAQLQSWVASHVRFLCWNSDDEAQLRNAFPNHFYYAQDSACYRALGKAALGIGPQQWLLPEVTYAIPPQWGPFYLFRKGIFQRYHKKNARIIAFLPENPKDTRAALEQGADEILTNHEIIY